MRFKDFWKNSSEPLTEEELGKVRGFIFRQEEAHVKSSVIIGKLQKLFPKLSEYYKAERAYWTEVKRIETEELKASAIDVGYTKFRILPSPGACESCLQLSNSGQKVFDKAELEKGGQAILPHHPNCRCVLHPIK